MTKEEKIDILWDMMWLNFKENFCNKGICVGLCKIFEFATDFTYHNMGDSIPELIQHTTHPDSAYWWPYKGRFIPWWERHKAIWKTIKQLKKS